MIELLQQPWAILPERGRWLRDRLREATEEQPERKALAKPVTRIGRGGRIAVLPLFGVMTQHPSWFGTSTEAFGREFNTVMANDAVDAVILEINSPGGQAFGTAELSDKIFAARGKKPIIAAVNSMAASAALWVASAADSISVTPGGEMGSVGVLMIHEDWSKALDTAGVKVSMIAQPPKKSAGNPFEPLSDEARESFSAMVDETYRDFVKVLARNRGVSQSFVRSNFGGGGMMLAKEAVENKLADRIETFDETISRVVVKFSGRARAAENQNRLRLAEAES